VATTVLANLIAAAIIYFGAVLAGAIANRYALSIIAGFFLVAPGIVFGVGRLSTGPLRLRCTGGRVPDAVGRIMASAFFVALLLFVPLYLREAPIFWLVTTALMVSVAFVAAEKYGEQLREGEARAADPPRQ